MNNLELVAVKGKDLKFGDRVLCKAPGHHHFTSMVAGTMPEYDEEGKEVGDSRLFVFPSVGAHNVLDKGLKFWRMP